METRSYRALKKSAEKKDGISDPDKILDIVHDHRTKGMPFDSARCRLITDEIVAYFNKHNTDGVELKAVKSWEMRNYYSSDHTGDFVGVAVLVEIDDPDKVKVGSVEVPFGSGYLQIDFDLGDVRSILHVGVFVRGAVPM